MSDQSDFELPQRTESADEEPRARSVQCAPIATAILNAAEAPFGKVVPLGHKGGTYFFISAAGEFVSLQSGPLCSYPGLTSLFGGDLTSLAESFPSRDRRHNGMAFSEREAGAALIRACVEKGIFDSTNWVRGRGVWRGPRDSVIVHCGDALLVDGHWRGVGLELDRAIYAAAPHIARPADQPADAELARELRAVIAASWQFAQESAADVIVGFIGQAFLGAYPTWRAHVLITGERGAGKTSLASLVCAAVGDLAGLSNDASAAGLRQDQTSESRAMILDEAEASSGGPSVQTIIELIRRMSSGAGAVSVRGTIEGNAKRYLVVGSAFMAAINPPNLKPQDRSRITEIELRKLVSGDAHPDVVTATERAKETSSALWARALAGIGRYEANLEVWKVVLREHGCDPRQAEQPAALLAAYCMLVEDEPITETVAKVELSRYAWMIQTATENDDESSPRECLNYLLGSVIDVGRDSDRKTIGQLLGDVERDPSLSGSARKALERHGIRPADRGSDGFIAGFMVANKNPNLRRIFAGTDWASDGWGRELKRLLGAGAYKNPVSIANVQSRVTFVPHTYLSRLTDDESA